MWSFCTCCSPVPMNEAYKTQENNIWHLYSPKHMQHIRGWTNISSTPHFHPTNKSTPNAQFCFCTQTIKCFTSGRGQFFNCGCYYFTVRGINTCSTSALSTSLCNYSMTKLAQTITSCSLKTGIARVKKVGKQRNFHVTRDLPTCQKKRSHLVKSAFLQARSDKAARRSCWLTMS